jgi:hypothetical protein
MTKRKGPRPEGIGGRTSTSRGQLAERVTEKPRSSALSALLHRVEPNASLVARSPSGDLFIYAKDLFVEAKAEAAFSPLRMRPV